MQVKGTERKFRLIFLTIKKRKKETEKKEKEIVSKNETFSGFVKHSLNSA